MLGKERNNNMDDSQFTDFAWSEMSSMLDQEMPVAKPSASTKGGGKYGLLLLFLLIGFGSGIGTMLLIQDGTPEKVENPIPIRKDHNNSVAENNIPIASNIFEKSKTENHNNQDQNQLSPNIKSENKTNSILNNQNKKSIDHKTLLLNSSSVIVFKDDHLKVSDQDQIDEDKIQPFDQILSDEFANVASDIVQDEADYTIANQSRDINALDILANDEIPFLNIKKEEIQLDLLPLKSKSKLEFGFYMGTQTRDFEGMHGLSGGLLASYHLDTKFSLRTGIGYSVLSGFHPETTGDIEPLTPEFFEPISTIVLDEYSTVASLESNQNLPVQSLQYLDLPLALNYKMSNNFGILMGMKFSYLLNAKTSTYFSENLNAEESKLLDEALYGSMRKMDFATVLGFGVYPTRKVGLELKYNHGLVDYTIDENWHVRQLNSNKTFELSLRYLFK